VAGSAYTYAYLTLGELMAWVIGWDLVLEYAVASCTVAHGWSKYLGKLLAMMGMAVPGVVHATDFPRAEIVAYQMVLSGVFAHTTDTLETFATWPSLVQAVPATSVALRVCEVSLLPHAAVVATSAITTTLVFHKRLT
jgi:APA family basic amino acid/polyamine antiporter